MSTPRYKGIPAGSVLAPGQAGTAGTLVTLAALSLSNTVAQVGKLFSSMIFGTTSGSSLTATSSDGTNLTVSGTTLTGTFSTVGSPTITLVETVVGATNSPRSTLQPISVVAAISFIPTYIVALAF